MGARMQKGLVTAVEMARAKGIEPSEFRAALRAAEFNWHLHGQRWTVERNSPKHHDMEQVLRTMK